MTSLIQHGQIADLCRGSVFLATGGGGDPYVNMLLVENALKKYGPVQLVSIKEVPDDAFAVAMGGTGAPTVALEQLPTGHEPVDALNVYEDWLGRKVSHVISFEIGGGNSVVPLIAAAAKGIPLVDGDGMGRALPETQMMTFAIHGIAPSPALTLDHLGNTTTLEIADPFEYERVLRKLAMAAGGHIFSVEQPMNGIEVRTAAVPGTISFAIELGETLRHHRGNADAIIGPLSKLFSASQYGVFRHLYSGKVIDIASRMIGGFDVGEATIEGFCDSDEPCTISIKNEFLVARIGERVVASVPDLITILDYETSVPINAERLRYGQRISVFGIGCPPHYRTEAALQVVAPRCFGFDFEFRAIEELCP